MATTYDIGDVVRVQNKYTTSTGSTAGADPTNVEFHYEKPDGAVVSATATSTGALVKSTTGVYYYDIVTTGRGLYEWRHTSTGTITTSVEGWFSVRPRRVTT